MPAFADRPKDYAYTLAFDLHTKCEFNVFPLKPRDKRPLFSWKKWQTEHVTEDLIEHWNEQYPDCNWAIACGPVSDLLVVDIDANDVGTQAWVKRYLPPTPFVVRTGKGTHHYYRYPKDPDTLAIIDKLSGPNLRNRFQVAIDLRIAGNYVVAPGSLHPSGAVYSLETGGISWAENTADFHFLENPLPQTAINVELNNLQGTRNNALASRVGSLINEGYTYGELLQRAKNYNLENNRPPLPEPEVVRTVYSIWQCHIAHHPPTPSQMMARDLDGLEYDTTNPLTDIPMPDAVLNPGGILGEIMDHIEAASVRTHRVYAYAGACTLMASMLGQRVQTETGLVTNMYFVCVGGSASGKDAPKKIVNRILSEIAPGFIGGHDVASDVAVLTQLERSPNSVFIPDEIGMFLKGAKQPNSAKYGLIKLLTELFSSPSTLYRKIYADSDNVREISWHCLCVLGMSVPEEFYGALFSGEATNGFLARIIVCEAPAGEIAPKKYDLQNETPAAISSKLRLLKAGHDIVDEIVPDENGNTPIPLKPSPVTVCMNPAALAHHRQKDALWDDKMREYERKGNSAAASIAGRMAEHAAKLALIYAASEKGDGIYADPEITIKNITDAWDAIEYFAMRTIAQVELSIAVNEVDAITKAVRKAILRYVHRERVDHGSEKPGAPYNVLSKALPGVLDDTLKKVLDKMISANELRVLENWKASEKSKRPLTLYCLVVEAPKEDPANKGDDHA